MSGMLRPFTLRESIPPDGGGHGWSWQALDSWRSGASWRISDSNLEPGGHRLAVGSWTCATCGSTWDPAGTKPVPACDVALAQRILEL